MPVELTWDGKYNADGTKRAPLRVTLPFQTVETVNESAQERQRTLDLFNLGRSSDWRNRLIWGDKKYVLPSLLPECAGKVNLIYIDPPFDTGADFSFQAQIGDETFTKEPSIIEQKAYRDTWGKGIDGYLQWLYETASLLYELLSDDGSIYVHINARVSSYVRQIMDDIFGFESYGEEIVWKRTSAHANAGKNYAAVTERILFYTKSQGYYWNPGRQKYTEEYIASHYSQVEPETGRRYTLRDLTASMSRASKSQIYDWRGVRPISSRCWSYTKEKMDQLFEEGKIVFTTGKMPRLKLYLDAMSGNPTADLWDDIPPVNSQSNDRVNYPTQKPEGLLKRIIEISSPPSGIVLDCFCGSGTTAVAAENLGRRWIACDLGRFAIHTTRKRLLGIPDVRPFVVQNLGKYERQAWQVDEFGPDAAARLAAYTHFILALYHAQPLTGFTWLHGVKAGRVVHVGSVDSPVTLADVTSIIIEWRRNLGKTGATSTGIDVLGWEFAFELNETARQQAAEAGVDLRFLLIPREVLEQKAVEQGDIQFFELAALFIEQQVRGRTLTLRLTNFIPPLEYIPPEIRQKITAWEAWIDYWAVDFNCKGDTFHNQWQSYRTRKQKKIDTHVIYTYEQPGAYTVQVKVIDILGNDTTRTLSVTII